MPVDTVPGTACSSSVAGVDGAARLLDEQGIHTSCTTTTCCIGYCVHWHVSVRYSVSGSWWWRGALFAQNMRFLQEIAKFARARRERSGIPRRGIPAALRKSYVDCSPSEEGASTRRRVIEVGSSCRVEAARPCRGHEAAMQPQSLRSPELKLWSGLQAGRRSRTA